MFSKFAAISMIIAAALAVSLKLVGGDAGLWHRASSLPWPRSANPEILIAHKKVTAARGGFIEARSGYLPSLSSSGLYDKRQTESQTNLRQERLQRDSKARNRTFIRAEQSAVRWQSRS